MYWSGTSHSHWGKFKCYGYPYISSTWLFGEISSLNFCLSRSHSHRRHRQKCLIGILIRYSSQWQLLIDNRQCKECAVMNTDFHAFMSYLLVKLISQKTVFESEHLEQLWFSVFQPVSILGCKMALNIMWNLVFVSVSFATLGYGLGSFLHISYMY